MKFYLQNFSFPILKSITVIGITTITLLTSSLQALAQWSENFSDGDFITNPVWEGNTDRFTAVKNVLQLNAEAEAGTAELTTPSHLLVNGSWKFTVAMNFNPSGSNYVRVYLSSNSSSLSSPLNGYYAMIGGATDEISLYRQEGTTRIKIIDGADGMVNSSAVTVGIAIVHNEASGWTLSCDPGLTGDFVTVGTSDDVPTFTPEYFGVQCVYTATRATGFSFDNFQLDGPVTEDNTPPTIAGVTVIDSSLIAISFSKSVEESTCLQKSNYLLGPTDQEPFSTSISADHKTVLLGFDPPMVNGVKHILSIRGIRDAADNEMVPILMPVMYFRARPHQPDDVVFSEVFADPSPPQSLPEEEFVELFNRSENAINLRDWTITDGSTIAVLPDHVLAAGEYLIVTRDRAKTEFDVHGTTVGLIEFPSLNNSGDLLQLTDDNGATIDSIIYSDSWYHDSVKKNGGWTMELIDPDNLCGDVDNWAASMSATGGTPGRLNSVDADNPDLTAPQISSVIPIGRDTVRIVWNERLSNELPSVQNFSFSPPLTIRTIEFHNPSLRETDIILGSTLIPSTEYSMHVSGVGDCSGNKIENAEVRFALPERAVPGDVVINEILFDPTSTGVDFVELWNISGKFIDLSTLRLAKPVGNSFEEIKPIAAGNVLLSPNAILVATTEPDVIRSEYIRSIDKPMIACELPPLPDDEGSIALLGESDTLLDVVTYSSNLHSPFLENVEGVSLERISVDRSIPSTENWKSAASWSGYATPGDQNSNFRDHRSFGANVQVMPESFAPREGQFTQIWYSFAKPGLMANVNVFDSQGRALKTLAKAELLGTAGFIRWDGDSDEGVPLRTGAYMIVFEVFDRDGVVSRTRKRVVIGGKF
jgi:hypothetical protein